MPAQFNVLLWILSSVLLILVLSSAVMYFCAEFSVVDWTILHFSGEYVADTGTVRSLCLAQTSGRLLATGGEDCQINLWSLDKPNCLMVSTLVVLLMDFRTAHFLVLSCFNYLQQRGYVMPSILSICKSVCLSASNFT